MTDAELKMELKILVFDNSIDEQETSEDGLRIGLLSNEGLYNEVKSLINYYKNIADESRKSNG
jgi:hypothetical protein